MNIWVLFLALGCLLLAAAANAEETARITVDFPEKPIRIDPAIYGQFLEHIFDSVMDGLYAEMVQSRSFEEPPGGFPPKGSSATGGAWTMGEKTLYQRDYGLYNRLFFGDPKWKYYVYEFEARKLAGSEGFIAIFRAKDKKNLYWWNIGGWSNSDQAIQSDAEGRPHKIQEKSPLKVESDRWYRIKIVVQGNRMEGYLDGVKRIKISDVEQPSGAVGLGTYATEAAFRNVTVRDLEGNTLFELPLDEGFHQEIATPWQAYGSRNARYFIDDKKPANSRFSQRMEVEAGAGWVGIQQKGFCVRRSGLYRGSVWLRTNSTADDIGGQIGLVTSEGRGVYMRLGPITTEWKEFKFRLAAHEDREDAALIIRFDKEGIYWVDQVSLMPETVSPERPFRTDIFEKVKAIRPNFIRWPGGCFAERYRWMDGIGPQVERVTKPNYPWGGLDNNGFGTAEFIQLCREAGAKPMICLNIGQREGPENLNAYIQEALDWIEYCNGTAKTKFGSLRKEHGYPEPFNVKYWEIGNETWHLGSEEYCRRAQSFLDAIRAKYPRLKLLVCGSGDYDQEWNRKIIEKLAGKSDYLSVHHYCGSMDHWIAMADPTKYGDYLKETGEMIEASANPKMKLAVTEWNLVSMTLRGGLYAASILNVFERDPDLITASCPAIFIGKEPDSQWSLMLINHNKTGSFVAPNFLAMKLYRDNLGRYLLPTKIEGPMERNAEGKSVSVLDVVASKSSRGRFILKVVNRHPENDIAAKIILTKGAKVGEKYDYQVLTAPSVEARNTLTEPNTVSVTRKKGRIQGKEWVHTFPARSVTVINARMETD